MKRRSFFALSLEETKYYSQPHFGWEAIIERFPQAVMDIEEARKCFALSRYAASVFHSVQIVEAGLIDLGGFLEVTDPISGWTAVANALKKAIAKPYPQRTEFERANGEFIEQLQGTVEALKNAWRNKISHAHGRLSVLTADYNPEIAVEILYATRAFMRRLAEGLPSSEKAE
jgi:hypothetical protein